jgi:hypothetical protein
MARTAAAAGRPYWVLLLYFGDDTENPLIAGLFQSAAEAHRRAPALAQWHRARRWLVAERYRTVSAHATLPNTRKTAEAMEVQHDGQSETS